MLAVIELGGTQWKVSPGDRIVVNRLPQPEGTEFTLSEVLLLEKDGQVQVGKPTLSYPILVKVLEHVRGPKVRVFKKKRRKGYEKRIGHRQALSVVEIQFS
jgi:large subunit ribosomal protein L21